MLNVLSLLQWCFNRRPIDTISRLYIPCSIRLRRSRDVEQRRGYRVTTPISEKEMQPVSPFVYRIMGIAENHK